MRRSSLSQTNVAKNFAAGYRGSGTNMFTDQTGKDGRECNEIFSYGYHFTIAAYVPKAARHECPSVEFIINGDKRSISTGKHQREVQMALGQRAITISFSALPFDLASRLRDGHAVVVDGARDDYECSYNKDQRLPERCAPENGWTITKHNPAEEHGLIVSAHRPGGLLIRLRKKALNNRYRKDNGQPQYCPAGLYLCGMDEGSYFVTLLPTWSKAKTILQAFEDLKPRLKDLEDLADVTPVRQGEWFFYPQPDMKTKDLEPLAVTEKIVTEDCERDEEGWPKRDEHGYLISKKRVITKKPVVLNNCLLDERALDRTKLGDKTSTNKHVVRDIRCDKDGNIYCRGQVRHINQWGNRADHRAIMLKEWHLVMRNTARYSWSSTSKGGVD